MKSIVELRMRLPKDASKDDIWFAWHPIITGALGTGRLVWLKKVWRNKCCGVTIYQTLKDTCEWVHTYTTGEYATDCGEMFTLSLGTIQENKYHFCPNCGKRIEE